MPSLLSISERDLSEVDERQLNFDGNAKTKQSDEKDVILESTNAASSDCATDDDVEETTVGESDIDHSDKSDAVVSSSDEPLKNPIEKTGRSTSTSIHNNKKRPVTPSEDSGSKQKQQKKVNQMTLSSFFFQGNNKKATVSTTSSAGNKKKKNTAETDGTLASNSSPRKASPTKLKSSSTTRSKKNITADVEVINLDESDDEQVQVKSTAEGKSTDKELTAENNPPSDKDKTENVDSIELGTDTRDKKDPAINTLAVSSVEAEAETATEASSTNTTNLLPESEIKKQNPVAPASPVAPDPATTSKSNKKAKRSSARKPKQSASTKKAKSSESTTTTTTTIPKKTLSVEDLSKERRALIQKYKSMKGRYLERALEVLSRYRTDGLDEEDLGAANLQPITDEHTELKTNDANHCEEFPTQVVTNMALLIEGR